MILRLKSFGDLWGSSCAGFAILCFGFHFTVGWYVKVLIGLLFYFFVVLPVLTVSRVWGYFVHGSAISSFGVEWCGAGGLQFQFSVNFFAGVDRVLVWGGLGTGLWVLVLWCVGGWALGYGSIGFWDLLDVRSYSK